MKGRVIKIACSHKQFRLGDEWLLHGQSYQIFPPLGILNLCWGLKGQKSTSGSKVEEIIGSIVVCVSYLSNFLGLTELVDFFDAEQRPQ